MIVIIQPPSDIFSSVRYNIDKVEQDLAEVLVVANFGALGTLSTIKIEDYVNYLESHSSASPRAKRPEFHAIISCQGASHGKQELQKIAIKWLSEMGYENQPYILFFHKDSQNNHIHVVSSRIQRAGRRINNSFEKIRGYEALNRIMGLNEQQRTLSIISKLMDYSFSRQKDFAVALQAMGYSLRLHKGKYLVFQYCSKRAEIPLELIATKLKKQANNANRVSIIKKLLAEHNRSFDATPHIVSVNLAGGRKANSDRYSSALAQFLLKNYGLEILYHHDKINTTLDYALIDHEYKAIYSQLELITLNTETRPRHDHSEANSTTVMANEVKANDQLLLALEIDIAQDVDDELVFGKNRKKMPIKKKNRSGIP